MANFTTFCNYSGIHSLSDTFQIFQDASCYKHTFAFGTFLVLANLAIFIFGLVGNSMVIYVVMWKIKRKTASTLFILNLAVADLLVILGCIPWTLIANLVTPWVLGTFMCKIVAYGQGVSVFCAVYSLVAISFDRLRAVSSSNTGLQCLTNSQAINLVSFIWLLGIILTLPWAFVFQVVTPAQQNGSSLESGLPYCTDIWDSKTLQILYFFLIHVFACFLLPFMLITGCDVVIWRNVRHAPVPVQLEQQQGSNIVEAQRRRKVRVLKMFTALTFAFFLFWLPLYVIMAKVKFFYDDLPGSVVDEQEQSWISVLIPIVQVLASCNSCINPVLYAMLNQTFRENFLKILLVCKTGTRERDEVVVADRQEGNENIGSTSRL